MEESQKTVLEKVEHLFNRKFLQVAGAIVGSLSIMFGIVTFLRDHGITGTALGWVALVAGLAVIFIIYLLSTKS